MKKSAIILRFCEKNLDGASEMSGVWARFCELNARYCEFRARFCALDSANFGLDSANFHSLRGGDD